MAGMETETLTVDPTDQTPRGAGSRTAYLTELARAYPLRGSHGIVLGFYTYSGYGVQQKRVGGPYATEEEAQGWADQVLDGTVICGPVFTATGKIVREQ